MNFVGGRCVRRDVGDEVWEMRCGICLGDEWEMRCGRCLHMWGFLMQTATGTRYSFLSAAMFLPQKHMFRCKGHAIFLQSIFVCNGPVHQTEVAPRWTKRCACHAQVGPCAQSAAPATRKQPGPSGVQARAGNRQRVKVVDLPRKISRSMCTKCCACHAKAAGAQRRPSARRQSPESQSAAPAKQK